MAIVISPALTGFSSAFSSTAPNNVVPVALFRAAGAASNIDAAMIPKGTGAALASLPDNGVGGGNKRGANATDWQRVRSAATDVASGSAATIGGGTTNRASGNNSTVAGGASNIASGLDAAIGGGTGNNATGDDSTVAGGNGNSATGTRGAIGGGASNVVNSTGGTIPGGVSGSTRNDNGKFAYSSSSDYGVGGAQMAFHSIKGESVNAAAQVLRAVLADTDGSVLLPPSTGAYSFFGICVARESATGDVAAWRFEGIIKIGATVGTTTLVASTVTSLGADAGAAAWVLALSADAAGILGGLNVSLTGDAGATVRGSASVWTAELGSF